MEEKLKLQFDPHTIEHLGIKMYSQLPFALAELVANAYDANAETVHIKLYDNLPEKKIVIIDDGDGMSYEELGKKFLIIGRKRRDSDEERENAKGRKITGKKGLGKLALFGIGKTIKIETTKYKDETVTCLTLNWNDILGETSGTYYPGIEILNKEDPMNKGTVITLSELSRVSGFDLENTATALSKLFNWLDIDFSVYISRNDEQEIKLTRELRYQGINTEFEWDIADIISQIEDDYYYKKDLRGYIVSSKKPMKPELRGITLYVNGRMANVPSFFGLSEAGHTFSYISGWIDADFLDEFDEDLISTDRQSVSWDIQEAEELQLFLRKIVRFLVNDWSAKRRNAKQEENSKRSGINTTEWIQKIPEPIRPKLENIINSIADKPEIDDTDYSAVVKNIHDLIPPYTYYHYRMLHEQIQSASQRYYEDRDYYTAFQEAIKRYKNAVKDKAGLYQCSEDMDIVSKAFGKGKPLTTTAKYRLRPNGEPFSEATLLNIEEGQLALSRGVIQGGRNVVSHEEHRDLRETGLFSEIDCLDLLSLLSHLFKRLDDAQKDSELEDKKQS